MMVNFVLIATTLCLFCGLAVDAGYMQFQKQRMQNAADAAALGAAYASAASGNTVTAGRADAALNGFTNGASGVTVNIITPTSGSYKGNSSAFEADVSKSFPTMFMGLLGFKTATVNARGVAARGASTSCAYALDPSKDRAFQVAGATASIGCGTFIDSSASDGLELEGNGTLTSSSVSIVGGSQANGEAEPANLKTGVAAQTDPLADFAQPAFNASNCPKTDPGGNINSGSGKTTLNPGYYCGGINISGQTVILNPGLYVITGGINWNGSSTITGTGVTLFFTSQTGSSGYGQVTISGGVSVTLTAPTSGATEGIAMFGDRNWTNSGQVVNFNGGSSVKIDGILYFPNNGIIFTGQTSSDGNYLAVVADNVVVNGGASLNIPTPNYSQLSGGSPFKSGVILAE